MSDLQYPIGPFKSPGPITPELQQQFITDIEQTPAKLRAAVSGLNATQLDTPYRQGGWTVRQVVHHLSDANVNQYVRVRLIITEDAPKVKTFAEEPWAELTDARTAPVELSLDLLDALHKRWALLLRSIKSEQWSRTMNHPELGITRLDDAMARYTWHGRHHVAHITSLRQRMGW